MDQGPAALLILQIFLFVCHPNIFRRPLNYFLPTTPSTDGYTRAPGQRAQTGTGTSLSHLQNQIRFFSFTIFRAKERGSRCKRNPHNAAFSARVEAKADSDEEGGKAKNSPEAENPAQSRPKTKCAFQSGTK